MPRRCNMIKADKYNSRVELAPRELTVMTLFWQQHHGLAPDGRFGDDTRGSLGTECLSDLIVRYAEQEIGHGEADSKHNNTGGAIERYRREGTGKDAGTRRAWCAQFTSYVCLKAGVDFKPHSGAKRVTRNIAAGGSWVIQPRRFSKPKSLQHPAPGDVIAWHRGKDAGDWRGHVEVVVKYDAATDTLTTVGGNHNNRTDDVGRRYAVVDYFTYENGSWRKRLYGIARPRKLEV